MGRAACTEPHCLYKGALYLTLPLLKQVNKGSQMNSFEPIYIHTIITTNLFGEKTYRRTEPDVPGGI